MSDDDKKPPSRGTKRKDPEPSSDQQGSIWDTVSGLNGYPLVRVAIELAEQNFSFCLSKSYDIVDKEGTTDHLKVIR